MKKLVLLVSAAAILAACAMPNLETGASMFSMTQQPMMVGAERGTKIGRACARNYFGIYTEGDMSVATAKLNGNITKVATVDKDVKGYLIYAEVCTVVTGY
jgi:hypothetical protein